MKKAVLWRAHAYRRRGHATELAREAVAAGADLILVLGGDGTVNEVANGMIPSRSL